jgi:hypothetical protein
VLAALASLAVILLTQAQARAQAQTTSGDPMPSAEDREDRSDVTPDWRWIRVTPSCEAFVPGGADARVDWARVLSFAACVQDASVGRVTEAAQLGVLVEALSDALSPAVLLYLEAIQHGPPDIQVRAAYMAGLAHVALITRLRSSIAMRTDPTNPEAAVRYGRLHDQLEPLLAPAQQTARMAFTVVGRAAERDPTLAYDPVLAHMIASARATLRAMNHPVRDWMPPYTTRLAGAPQAP